MGLTVGVVGGGQLARMLFEAALALDLHVVFYVRPGEEGVRGWAAHVVEGPLRFAELYDFGQSVDVVTFEHELVDERTLRDLEAAGVDLAPRAEAMVIGSNKLYQRRLCDELGLRAVPYTLIDRDAGETPRATPPYLLKAVRGGYDGRGLRRIGSSSDELPREGLWLVEPELAVDAECAAVVARGRDGTCVTWEPVELRMLEGICVEAAWPSPLDAALSAQARRAARSIAVALDFVGVLAVEFFVVDGELVVNEIAPRVHNSGHLTIEGATTSQFENHLRAVAGLPLGSTAPISPAVMVNLIGAPAASQLPSDVRVHRYGKTPRPRRKVGHVTALAADVETARQHARRAARLMGGELVDRLEEIRFA